MHGMIADVDAWNYGDTVLHLGGGHQYNDDLKAFIGYYRGEGAAPIGTSNDSFPAGPRRRWFHHGEQRRR